MKKIVMKAARMEKGYSCACNLMPGWVVAYTGGIEGFKDYVRESVDFWIEGRKARGEKVPKEMEGEYELVYDFDINTLLDYYRGVFSFASLQSITGINQRQLAHYASGVSSPRAEQERKIKEGLRRLAKDIETVTC